MSFPRLALLALGLPLLVGGCAAAAVSAVSYGADGVSLVDSGKTTTDHFASMVSKKDCALWRFFRNQRVCHEREAGKDPYKVDYDSVERQPSEDGVAYTPPLRASADAPPTSWTADAYPKPAAAPAPAPAPTPAAEPVAATAETTPASPPPAPRTVAHASAKKKKPKAHTKAVRKSPGQAASDP
jgi:hypothetical protein